jgi:hypothetical protein
MVLLYENVVLPSPLSRHTGLRILRQITAELRQITADYGELQYKLQYGYNRLQSDYGELQSKAIVYGFLRP